MVLLQVVARREEAEALEAQRPLVAVESQPDRLSQAVGAGEGERDGDVVDLRELHRLAVDHPFRVRGGGDVGVGLDRLPPEDDVIDRERRTVGPLQAAAQVQGQLGAVLRPRPLPGQTGLDRVLGIARPAQHRLVIESAEGVEVLDPLEGAAPRAAVLADRVDRLDHQRIFRQPLAHRRQIARGDHLLKHRRFVVLSPCPAGDEREARQQRQQFPLIPECHFSTLHSVVGSGELPR